MLCEPHQVEHNTCLAVSELDTGHILLSQKFWTSAYTPCAVVIAAQNGD